MKMIKDKKVQKINKEINIFIISPSDVNLEREMAKDICNQLNSEVIEDTVVINSVMWEYKPQNYHVDAQGNFNAYKKPFTKSDIVVVILWERLGSFISDKYIGKITKKSPLTGTQWEIEEVIAYKDVPILFYFKTNEKKYFKSELEEGLRQKNLMDSFFDDIDFKRGTPNRGYHEFNTDVQFKEKLIASLKEAIKKSHNIDFSSSLQNKFNYDEEFREKLISDLKKDIKPNKMSQYNKLFIIVLVLILGLLGFFLLFMQKDIPIKKNSTPIKQIAQKKQNNIPRKYNLSGMVMGKDDHKKIVNARIQFHLENSKVMKETYSNKNGFYYIQLDKGRYQVIAAHPKYSTYNTGDGFFVIRGNKKSTGNIDMPKAQKHQSDMPPMLQLHLSTMKVKKGEDFQIQLTGMDDVGLDFIWWFGDDTNDFSLNKAHTFNCNNKKVCSHTWTVSTEHTGVIKISANARDNAYPIIGEAHQLSEGQGIISQSIEVVE